jgi:hypothetical protein
MIELRIKTSEEKRELENSLDILEEDIFKNL